MSSDPSSTPLVTIRNVTKAYPGVLALDDVSLDLFAGEVHALLGENGAGKSTMIKVMTGALQRDAGNIEIDGVPTNFSTTSDAQEAGVSTAYQEVNLIPAMSVVKNLTLEKTGNSLGVISWRRAREEARKKLARLNLDIDVEQPVGMFPVAIQQLVAIARALDENTKLLVLDEPTASLDAEETATLFDIMRDLKSKGIGIVFITHFIDQVYEISDRISVLRNGRHVGTKLTPEYTRADLISTMIGKELGEVEAAFSTKTPRQKGEIRIKATGLGKKRVISPFDLTLHAGEVVGLAGLLGSGRSELTKTIFGAIKNDSGTIEVNGSPATRRSPRASLNQGIAFCPEDRKSEGLVGELSVRENIILSMQAKRGWLNRVPRKTQAKLADEMIQKLGIATPDAEKPVRQLSGGNQQKVVLARALASDPTVMLLDEPTRGIDVGAHAEILNLIRKLCEDGLALLVASSELDEVVASSDRVVVLRDREKIGEIVGEDLTRDKIVQMIAGTDDT